MARPSDDGLLVESGSGREVEILDPVASRSTGEADSGETLEPSPSRWRSIWPAMGAVFVAGLAVVTLSVAGNTPAPEPPAPSVTTPRNELDPTERRQLEAAYGVRIGEGPGLMWEPVNWEIGSTELRWIDDGFVADDGTTEWTIRGGLLGPNVAQRQSLLVTYPSYRLVPAEGARVLAPLERPLDHLLVFGLGAEPVRLDLPTTDEPPTDLLRRERFIDVAVIDAMAVALFGEFATIDSEALSLRIGREVDDIGFVDIRGNELYIFGDGSSESVSLDDITLSAVELELLQNPLMWAEPDPEILRFDLTAGTVETIAVTFDMSWGELQRSGDQFVLEWADDFAANNRSTSFGGRSWTTKRGTDDPYTVVGDKSHLYGLSPGAVRITRSTDGGSTWRRTTNPLRDGTFLVVDDVIVLQDSDGLALRGEDPLIPLDAGDYQLLLSADGESFVLSDPRTSEVISSGRIGDAAAAAMYDALGNLYFENPETGERLLTVARRNILAAFDSAGVITTPLTAMTRWTDGEADPAWSIEEATDVFGSDVVSLDFFAGEGHILAVVGTATGPQFYLAATQPPLN